MKKQIPLLLLPVLLLLSLLSGSTDIAMADVLRALFCSEEVDVTLRFIVLEARMPQTLTAVLSGASLAVAGLLMQTVFANPLADPSLLGVNSGAGLGVAIAVLLFGGVFTVGSVTLSGFVLTMVAAGMGAGFVILLLLAAAVRMQGRLALLVTGVMISFAATALISLLTFWSTAQGVQIFTYWGLGSFSGVPLQRIPLFAVMILSVMGGSMLLSRPLNAMLLGDDYATNAGVNVRRVRRQALAASGLLTAMVTALCGPISFIGIAVPHAARMLLHTADHCRLLPATMFLGADIALLAGILAQLPGDRGVLPINVLTPIIGIPVVFAILLRGRHNKI